MNDNTFNQSLQLKSQIQAYQSLLDKIDEDYDLHFVFKSGNITLSEGVLKSMIGATDYTNAVEVAKTTIIDALTTKRDDFQTQYDNLQIT